MALESFQSCNINPTYTLTPYRLRGSRQEHVSSTYWEALLSGFAYLMRLTNC